MAPLLLQRQNVSSLVANKEKKAGSADMGISVLNLTIKFSECCLCSVGVSGCSWGNSENAPSAALKYRGNIEKTYAYILRVLTLPYTLWVCDNSLDSNPLLLDILFVFKFLVF